MEKKKYHLVIKVPFEAIDDVEARKYSQLDLYSQIPLEKAEFKLQEVYEDKPPRGISL